MASSAIGRSNSVRRSAHSALVALVAALATLLIGVASTIGSAVQLLAYTPIIMTGTFTSHPGAAYVAMAINQYIKPSRDADHPPQTPDYNAPIALDTPEQAWPISGLSSYTFDASIRAGLRDLQKQIAKTAVDSGGQPIIVFGFSQSAVIAVLAKRRLAAQYPVGAAGPVPDIQFALIGDLDRPNGGLLTRFGLDGPAPVHTNFQTVDITRQYDGFADFPLYPLDLLADLNALAGMLYVHTQYQAVSLDPLSARYVPGTTAQQVGDTTYYTIPTAHLPLLQPLRDLGVPEPLLAAVEPTLKMIVEAGYDRTISPGVPTPARLLPPINPAPKSPAATRAPALTAGVARAGTLRPAARVHTIAAKVSRPASGATPSGLPAHTAHAKARLR